MSIVSHPLNVLVDGGLGLGTNMLLSMDFSSPEVVLLRLRTERKNNNKKKIKTKQGIKQAGAAEICSLLV